MNPKEDPAYGVKCFSIAGRMMNQRERCMGMTDEERRWRSQFLKDQELSPEEPRFVPEYFRDTTNIFRRCWIYPMMKFEQILKPVLGPSLAHGVRQYVGKTSFMIAVGYYLYYYFKYTSNDWTTRRSWEIFWVTGRQFPDEPGFPKIKERKPLDYADFGFSESPFYKK